MSEANTIKDEAQASATPVASATTTVPAPVPVAVQPQAQPAPQAAPIVQLQHVQAPTFLAPLSSQTQHAIQTKGTPATLNLDDIFEDCFFTPDGDAVFLSETTDSTDVAAGATAAMQGIQVSGETIVSNVASRPLMTPAVQQVQPNPVSVGVVTQGQPGVVPTPAPVTQFAQVPLGGGIATTGLLQAPGERATVMGTATPLSSAPPKLTPMVAPPQQKHHLQYAIPASGMPKRRGTAASARERKMSDQQKTERRERNREHAKRSRIRKKFLLESLQQSVTLLKEENDKLRDSIRSHLGDETANELLQKENLTEAAAAASSKNLIASNSKDANKVLDDPDFSFIKALQTAQQNFVVTDPSLPDNPIVYATQGFLNLTGYTLDQVLGRNCRFLQGPETDPRAVEKIRRSIEDGSDMSVCLLNYRVDGSTFWNQFFIAALRDAAGNITNYVGVQCKVSDQYAANVCRKQEEEDNALAGEGTVPAGLSMEPTPVALTESMDVSQPVLQQPTAAQVNTAPDATMGTGS